VERILGEEGARFKVRAMELAGWMKAFRVPIDVAEYTEELVWKERHKRNRQRWK
jgi:hypothetical protein